MVQAIWKCQCLPELLLPCLRIAKISPTENGKTVHPPSLPSYSVHCGCHYSQTHLAADICASWPPHVVFSAKSWSFLGKGLKLKARFNQLT